MASICVVLCCMCGCWNLALRFAASEAFCNRPTTGYVIIRLFVCRRVGRPDVEQLKVLAPKRVTAPNAPENKDHQAGRDTKQGLLDGKQWEHLTLIPILRVCSDAFCILRIWQTRVCSTYRTELWENRLTNQVALWAVPALDVTCRTFRLGRCG